jgi:hypothetical protein
MQKDEDTSLKRLIKNLIQKQQEGFAELNRDLH